MNKKKKNNCLSMVFDIYFLSHCATYHFMHSFIYIFYPRPGCTIENMIVEKMFNWSHYIPDEALEVISSVLGQVNDSIFLYLDSVDVFDFTSILRVTNLRKDGLHHHLKAISWISKKVELRYDIV